MSPRDLAVIVLVVLGGVVLLPVLMMSMWGGWGMMGRWGYGAGFGLLVLLLAGIALIVLVFTRKAHRGEEPLELINRRLAKGEITKGQYDELRQMLR